MPMGERMIRRDPSALRSLPLRGPLRKFHPENQMPVTPAIHLLACPGSVRPIDERYKCKAFGPASVSVLGQEHSRDTAEPLEEIA